MNDSSHVILNGGYSHPAPLFTHAEGNHLFHKSEAYVDMAMGAGSLIHGHAFAPVVSAIQSQSQLGTLYLRNTPVIQELSQTIYQRLPAKLKYHIYCNSGSEATQRAIRLARAATGRVKIASFHGGWHGMNEWTLFDDGGRFGDSSIKPYTGIPSIAMDCTMQLPYNQCDAFDVLEQQADEIAAVIIEPVQGSNPQPQISNYLKQLTEVCRKHNILIIFDEVITGFRIHPGGASRYFNIEPDIATYGKVMGGGLPIGLLTCSEDVYNQTFALPEKTILTGGTFSANPLSAASGLATLEHLTPDTYAQLRETGHYFRALLNDAFEKTNIPFTADGVESISRLYFTDIKVKNRSHRDSIELSPRSQAAFRQNIYDSKIIWPTNGIVCHATCQDNALLEQVCNKVIDACRRIL